MKLVSLMAALPFILPLFSLSFPLSFSSSTTGLSCIIFFLSSCPFSRLIFTLVSEMAQKLLVSRGNSLAPSSLLKSGLASYSSAVRMRLTILNSFRSTCSRNLRASSFLSGMTMMASPPSFSSFRKISRISCGGSPLLRISAQSRQSNSAAVFPRSLKSILQQFSPRTPFFSQFLLILLTTSSRVSHMTTSLQSVHFLSAMPATPTPAFSTTTSFPRNRSLSRMANRARTMSESQSRRPSSSWGKRAMSEIMSFILKAQWRSISLLRSRRMIFWPSLAELGRFPSLPISDMIIISNTLPSGKEINFNSREED